MMIARNGDFAGRLAEVAAEYGIEAHIVTTERGLPVTPDACATGCG